MATLSSTVSVKVPQTRQGGGGSTPPTFGGGGGDGRGGNGSPDYGERLRRARLGLAVGLTPVIMLFVSFTNAYVHDWLPVNLPWVLLLINTVILVVSSVTMELARRQITRQAALAPVTS